MVLDKLYEGFVLFILSQITGLDGLRCNKLVLMQQLFIGIHDLTIHLIQIAVLVGKSMESAPILIPFIHQNITFQTYLGSFSVDCDTGMNSQFSGLFEVSLVKIRTFKVLELRIIHDFWV